MKLRIKDNSIRLRLTKSEVANLKDHKKVSATTKFGFGSAEVLEYCLEIDPRASNIEAHFDGSKILIKLPQNLASEWTSSERVALMHEQKVSYEQSLKILIEKDFFCLKPRQNEVEDESDMYTNPSVGACGTC